MMSKLPEVTVAERDQSLSIVIPWYNRFELGRSIARFVEEASTCCAEIVIVNWGGESQLLGDLLGKYESNVSIITLAEASPFNKPTAQNIGFHFSTGNLVFFCDCDIVLGSGTCLQLIDALLKHPEGFATLASVFESTPTRTEGAIRRLEYTFHIEVSNGRRVSISDHEEDPETGGRKAPGLLCIRREHFSRIQGYKSSLVGWGWEDQDLICRLSLGLGLERLNIGTGTHLTHDDILRTSAYGGGNKWTYRDRAFRESIAAYDAASFLGTLVIDVDRTDQLVLRRGTLDACFRSCPAT